MDPAARPSLTVLLANPRGFCAGVERAIRIVEMALEKYGRPVHVRHEIVHNRHVVEDLEAKGAVFVEELDEAPDGATVIFSAHGVPKAVPLEAQRRGLDYLDATCPLVSKVHREVERHAADGFHILLIGHAGHPEVVGTMGQLPPGAISLIESIDDALAIVPPAGVPLAYATQTTLSIDDAAAIVEALQRRFPALAGPRREDICYATTNRQEAVKALAAQADAVLVIGSPNSSNSVRLVEVAERRGVRAALVPSAGDIPWDLLHGMEIVGLTAGASAPEAQVRGVLDALSERFAVTVEQVTTTTEDVTFKLPRALSA